MLVDSSRLLPSDRDEWARLERYDRRLARGTTSLADRARAAIEAWAEDRDTVVVSTSWGKDSVTVADLALTSRAADRVRLVWVRSRWFECPDTEHVRDVFLARYPGAAYEERWVTSPRPRRWDHGQALVASSHRGHRAPGRSVWPHERVTGIRAAESRTRELSAAVHGVATGSVCRPILRWSTSDVFAYLAGEGLPVHPAYAMVTGSATPREWIRVHSLGGVDGGEQRAAWEDAYYGDVIADDRIGVVIMRVLPDSKRKARPGPTVVAEVLRHVGGGMLHQGKTVIPGPVDVGRGLHRLHGEGLVARWERYGHESWWRWADRSWPIPGVHTAGDLAP